ncbi:hypothetical protein [Tolumonas lignilytica]|uniref:hypothetical protein n=1 Tax=Tolumonas lignilytica TaxID=1283284 RepID=UPI000463CE2A|nr:hypothetical protein [Tolumonas lignilytica]
MIFNTTDNWQNIIQLESLLFFVQRIQELSYDHSEFLEKNISATVQDIIDEYIELLETYEKFSLSVNAKEVDLLQEELEQKIKNDPISTQLIGDKLKEYIISLKDGNEKNKINTLELLKLKLSPKNYLKTLRKHINEILQQPKQKGKIHNIATLMFEFLISNGYAKGTIYHFINTTFFNKKQKITKNEDINLFLDKFDLRDRVYDVYFHCSKLFDEIQDSCSEFNAEIIENKDFEYNSKAEKIFFKRNNSRSIIKCNNVKAKDYLGAMKRAEDLISRISDIFTLFHHKKKVWISNYCLVRDDHKKRAFQANATMNSMSKLHDYDIEDTKEILPVFIGKFGLLDDSLKRFTRAIDIHSLSLETKDASSQILNLWICLETLLINTKDSHISSIENAIQTVISNQYLKHRVDILCVYLKEWNSDLFYRVVQQLPELWRVSDIRSTLALVALKEFEPQAELLLAEMNEVPLLRYKFMLLVKEFQNKELIKKSKKFIEEKSIKDIRRVYRTRNRIVHQGALIQRGENIVEIAHYYLDMIINFVVLSKIRYESINSIDNFLLEQSTIKKHHDKFINSSDISSKNIISIIFGPDNKI